jgi:hypothetical protein
MVGTWEVTRVAVDENDQPHWNSHPDDPKLMGRELVIEPDHVRFNGGKEPNCKPARWRETSATWRELMDDLRRSPDSVPAPADYGLKVARKAKVTVVSVCATLGPEAGPVREEPYLIQEGPDRLVMHFDNQTLLIFSRRKAGATPTPSFPCAKASLPAEKAICGSFTLAAWDRSVALGWHRLLELGPSSEDRDRQKAFLRERNSCGADAACLEKVMSQRTTELAP